ncbi:Glutamate--cysteine ligase, divergent, of Alpha-and Beta-proteobacteria type [uncultured Candidatus Thioglobus sp.]|nr:Glutamate--cysteine ligase, divergent, of Alpha-and Beta-proteobacteria type [uncultured Candidatus Thioglobus sp.]
MPAYRPLYPLEQQIIAQQTAIELWFAEQWNKVSIPFYASVDLRNAGYKLAPVDTNLFPAGFNNLNPEYGPLYIDAIQSAIAKLPHAVEKILIVPENHTRNLPYLENLSTLWQLFDKAGYQVQFGTIQSDRDVAITIQDVAGTSIQAQPLKREGNTVSINGFTPDLIILNNDLSSGKPEILESLQQTVTPHLDMGWSNRLKSTHFEHYRQITKEFATHIDLDPWLLNPIFRNCGEIDFMQREGGDCLERNVAIILEKIQKKYDAYKIPHQPYAIVKADKGTYGLGIMTVSSTSDITTLNRKQRTRMSKIKEGQKVDTVIIQEGVYTSETWQQTKNATEPVVYTIGNKVIGGFYRSHDMRAANDNLNMPGMRLSPFPFTMDEIAVANNANNDKPCNRFYAYSVPARLALLAATKELHSLDQA